jgi:ATP-binding cassette subfamily B protein
MMNNNIIYTFFKLLAPKKFWFISLVLLMSVIASIPSIDSYLIKNILDYAESSQNTEDSFAKNMLIWAAAYALWWESINWMWRLYDYLYMKAMPETKSYVISQYFSYVQRHSHNFFQKNLAGFITSRIVDASRSLEMIFAALNEKIFRKIFGLTAAIFTLYTVNPVFATVFVLWLSVFLGLSAIFIRKVKTLSTNWARNRSLISGKIVDSISNIGSIRMYNNYDYEESYLQKYLGNTVLSEFILNWFMLRLRYFQGLSCSIMIFGMLYYLGILRVSGNITIGDFALVITLCISVADDIWDFTQEIGDMFEEIGAFSQSLDLLNSHDILDDRNAEKLKLTDGKIEFQNVTFRYKRNNNLFNNKTITINAGEKVGLVGYSGSGKTTFINLITRMFDIDSGKILIDNQDISSVSQSSLRENICVIPQEPILFNRSIIENIRYGRIDATDAEVLEASKKAHIHDDILKLPDKYETLCGEKGSALSGGQKQRIAIARAILKDSPILILDEATSALDSITEKQIQDSLEFLMKDKTVIVIAHRLSTLKNMDRILVFNKGSIVEDGTHSKLHSNNKLYRDLWDSQVGGYIL